MTKSKMLMLFFLGSLTLGLFITYILHSKEKKNISPTEIHTPTYLGLNTCTLIYDPEGNLSYSLKSEKITYYAENQISWFNDPLVEMHNKNAEPVWSIQANKAKLTPDRIMSLYQNVSVDALQPDSELKSIKTPSANINLVTLDVNSDDNILINGNGFYSTGKKLRGNLRRQSAQILENVKAHYQMTPDG